MPLDLGLVEIRFSIDTFGQVRLLKTFNFHLDQDLLYNVTIMVSDQGGFVAFSYLLVYLNVTSRLDQTHSLFECSIQSAKSELSPSDRMTLSPPLFITVR
jgi:hypothetical protein